jgi:hypothetical protein
MAVDPISSLLLSFSLFYDIVQTVKEVAVPTDL